MDVSNDTIRQGISKYGQKRLKRTASNQVADKVEVGEINHVISGFVRAIEGEAGQSMSQMRENPFLEGEQKGFPAGSAIARVLALCQARCYVLDIQYFIELSQQPHKVNLMILLCRLRN